MFLSFPYFLVIESTFQNEGMDDDYEEELEYVCEDDDLDGFLCTANQRVPSTLPLRRPLSTTFSLCVPPLTSESANLTSSTSVADNCENDGEKAEVDKIGAYFGYNGVDGLVPKPAYDAMLQRVKTLEITLGQTNREIRSHTSTIAEQQSVIHSLQQQLQQKEQQLQQATHKESLLCARERELDAKEQALELVARQQRKMLKKKPHDRDDESTCAHCGHPTVSQWGGEWAIASQSKDVSVLQQARRRNQRRDDDDERRIVTDMIRPAAHQGLLPRIPNLRDEVPARSQSSAL